MRVINMDSTEKGSTTSDVVQSPERKVPDRLVQKFEALRKCRHELCKKSTEKRMKQIQENVLKIVEEEFTSDGDLDVLREHDVILPGSCDRKRKVNECTSSEQIPLGEPSKCSSSKISKDDQTSIPANSEGWNEVKGYLGCNDHLKGLDKGKYTPKTKLDTEIEEAVAMGDFDRAEKLSDDLAKREFGTKIAEAFDSKKYAEMKKEKEETAKARKTKKLHWGFEHKHRWETKSNM